jgi:hypothetical protein
MKLSTILITILFFTLVSCDKDNREDHEFCNSITEGNYVESVVVINNFLNDLNYENSGNLGENSTLEQLENWLEEKPCILEAEITCFWCLFSNPPQGFLSMIRSDNSDTLMLWLFGSIPNRAEALYEK